MFNPIEFGPYLPQQKGCSQWLPDSTYFRYPYPTDLVFHVEDYKHDNGAGPRGQLAVHPAIAQFILDNAPWELWTPLKTDLSKQNNRFPCHKLLEKSAGLKSCVNSSGSIKVVIQRAHQSCLMWRMWYPDGSSISKNRSFGLNLELCPYHPISHPFRLPTSQAANVKRDGGINALDEVLQRVNGLELVNGYLRISAKSIGMQKYVICVCNEYFMWCREMGNRENWYCLFPLCRAEVLPKGIVNCVLRFWQNGSFIWRKRLCF